MRTEDIRNMAKAYAEVQEKAKNEELKGNQHKIDHDKDGKITAADFKGLRKKSKKETATKSTTTVSRDSKTDTDVQTQEAKIDEISKGKLGSYIKKANINTADAADQNARGAKQIGKVMKRFKGVGQAVDKLTGKAKVPAKEEADPDTVRMYKDNPHMMKKGGPGGLKGLNKSAQRDVKKAVRKESVEISEAEEMKTKKAKPTAQHGPDEKTRDTWEKQLSTRKGEKDFVDMQKSKEGVPEPADEPKVDALNFQKFKAMTGKIGKDNSRPADQKKGDNNIIPSATPVKQ